MRLGVLDVGSNTVHLLVVDAHPGAHPLPMSSEKTMLRLAEKIDGSGNITEDGAGELVATVAAGRETATALGCEDLLAFATSAVRAAANSAAVIERIQRETGVGIQVLSGQDEARLTFLAVRRWLGWSAGKLLVLDIGGGSLEIAGGLDEEPELACSLPLGAGTLTRTRFSTDPPERAEVDGLRELLDEQLGPVTDKLRDGDEYDRVVGTSKTFRSLARLTGAAPPADGPLVRRPLTHAGLRQLIAFISRMPAADLAELDGVGANRAQQLVAGALVAETAMRGAGIGELEICPWALREGVILRRLDQLTGAAGTSATLHQPEAGVGEFDDIAHTGTSTRDKARWSG